MGQSGSPEYQTDDMALVTYLRLNGFTPMNVHYQEDTCHWTFERTSTLLHLVSTFQDDAALVSPKQYSKNFKTTRGEFYTARSIHQSQRRG